LTWFGEKLPRSSQSQQIIEDSGFDRLSKFFSLWGEVFNLTGMNLIETNKILGECTVMDMIVALLYKKNHNAMEFNQTELSAMNSIKDYSPKFLYEIKI
jgi:hypothetical protein